MCGGEVVKTSQLQGDAPKECRVIAQVAPPQSLGVLDGEPVNPLQACALDPGPAVLNAAGMEIECSSDTQHQLGVKQGQKPSHEFVLPGCAKAHPNHVGLASPDSRDQRVLLCLCERAIGWGKGADDSCPGCAFLGNVRASSSATPASPP